MKDKIGLKIKLGKYEGVLLDWVKIPDDHELSKINGMKSYAFLTVKKDEKYENILLSEREHGWLPTLEYFAYAEISANEKRNLKYANQVLEIGLKNLQPSVASASKNWEETARLHAENAEFYRSILNNVAAYLGPQIFIDDIGQAHKTPFYSKIAGFVGSIVLKKNEFEAAIDCSVDNLMKDKTENFKALECLKKVVAIVERSNLHDISDANGYDDIFVEEAFEEDEFIRDVEKLKNYEDSHPESSPFEGSLKAISEERNRQDNQWGGCRHDDEHSLNDWKQFIQKQVNRLRFNDEEDFELNKKTFTKIAALAIAAMESQDRINL